MTTGTLDSDRVVSSGSHEGKEHGNRAYWVTWGILLVLTLAMVVLDSSPLPRVALVLCMVAAMLMKVSFIGLTFMHLRAERLSLVLVVVVGLLVTGSFLYMLILPDAYRILEMSGGG
jgi:cytochrome c oxidase subunit IV